MTLVRATDGTRTQEASNLWGNFFSKGNPDDLVVKVPSNWFLFFTSMLLSPDTFRWVAEFLSSPAVAQIAENQGNVTFIIPKECPVKMKPCLSNFEIDSPESETPGKNDAGKNKEVVIKEMEDNAASFKKRRASRELTPMIDTQVRRSERVMKNNDGFKPSTCLAKKCFCCSPAPPTLSPKVIKNLAVQFCGMDEEEVSDEVLMNKRKKTDPVASKANKDRSGPTGRQAEPEEEGHKDNVTNGH